MGIARIGLGKLHIRTCSSHMALYGKGGLHSGKPHRAENSQKYAHLISSLITNQIRASMSALEWPMQQTQHIAYVRAYHLLYTACPYRFSLISWRKMAFVTIRSQFKSVLTYKIGEVLHSVVCKGVNRSLYCCCKGMAGLVSKLAGTE